MQPLIVVSQGEAPALVLPASLLEAIGLRVGDVVEVSLSDQKLILQPMPDQKRRKLLEAATADVLERRRDAFQRLA